MATKHARTMTRSPLTAVKNALQVASEAESVEGLSTTHRPYPEATPSDDLRGIIIDRFLREVRSFASEIIEGTNRYRQLQALGEHLPHDYHDRFLIELIQNAHDVSDGGEVRIVFQEPSEGCPGLLYVANQGQPFSGSNFERICSIGWSDKDPSHDIGNKGLGFRSVLQVCQTPQIFSVHPKIMPRDGDTVRFDGFSFSFLPETREWVAAALQEVASGAVGADQCSGSLSDHLRYEAILFDEPSRVEKLRHRLADGEIDLFAQADWLSPYSLPIPSSTKDDIVRQLGLEGFVTVIRLPLNVDGAVDAVRRAVAAVTPEYVLFLPAITQLTIFHSGVPEGAPDLSREFTRQPLRNDDLPHPGIVEPIKILSISPGSHVRTNDGATQPDARLQVEAKSYWITRRSVEGPEIQEAVKRLPANWHEVKHAEVSLALEITREQPTTGRISIYLPTEQTTGLAVWVNAPFFGNLARTRIEFGEGEEYNRLLLREAAILLEDLRAGTAALTDESAGVRLIDLVDVRAEQSPLVEALRAYWKSKGLSWSTVPVIVRTKAGAGKLLLTAGSVHLPPQKCLEPGRVVSFERIETAWANIPARILVTNRREALERLIKRAGRDPLPPPAVIAEWLEKVAIILQAEAAPIEEWQRFYEEAADLLDPKNSHELRGRRVLLTSDGSLLAAGKAGPQVFAPPSRTPISPDDPASTAQVDNNDPRLSIPSVLREHVAFFEPRIQLVSTSSGRRQNRAGELLRKRTESLVLDFDTREIVNNILAPLLESLPQIVLQGSKEEEICGAALVWAYRLHSAAGESRAVDVKWETLRVSTDEGWLAGPHIYLSRGWGKEEGELLEHTFRGVKGGPRYFLVSPEKFRELLCIDEGTWSGVGEVSWTNFLVDQVGVWNRPIVHRLEYEQNTLLEKQPGLVFSGSQYKADPAPLRNVLYVPDEIFAQYRDFVRQNAKVDVVKHSKYVFQRQTFLDGLGQLEPERAKAFARLVVKFLPSYKKDLRTEVLRSNHGIVSGSEIDTLLRFALYRMKWIPSEGGSAQEELRSLNAVWFVAPKLLERTADRIQYSFVPHIEPSVARELQNHFAQHLLPFREIPPKSCGDALALLADLESSWNPTTPEHIDYFVGIWQDTLHEAAQRAKAEGLTTTSALAGVRKPARLLVRTPKGAGGSSVEWWNLSSEQGATGNQGNAGAPVYIPDDAALAHSLSGLLPIVVMRREHVVEQLALLQSFFGEHRVLRLSEVPLRPLITGDLDYTIDSAPSLLEDFRWLGLVALAVLAFGRAHEMKVDRGEFQEQLRKLRRVKIAPVQELLLALPNGEKKPFTCYYWADKETLLVSTDRLLKTLGDIAVGFRAIFEVADIEDTLARALDNFSPRSLEVNETPADNDIAEALRRVRIDPEQFALIQQSLLEDNEWVVARCIPAICAIRGWTTAEEVKPALALAQVQPDTIEAEVVRLLPGTAGFSVRMTELLEQARRVNSDEDMARWLWREAGVDLGQWNRSVQALGNKYHVLENDEIDTKFHCFVEELEPVCRALIREALRSNGRLAEYRQWKSKLAGRLSPEAQWRREYWQLPLAPVLALVWHALQELALDGLDLGHISSVLSEDVAGVTNIIAAAREVGLNVDHDEGATLQRADERMQNVHRECIRYLVARWGRNNPPPAQLPKGIVNPDGVEELLSRDDVVSLGEAGALDEATAIHFSLQHIESLRTHANCPLLDPLPFDLSSLRQILRISDEDLQRADKLLHSAQEKADERRRERQVGGTLYTIPRGDHFDGLRTHLDQNVSMNFGDTIDLFKPAPLVEPPQAQAGGGGGSRSPHSQSRKTQRDRDLVGAVGEYLVYRLFSKTLGVNFHPDYWKSANRRHFFAGSEGNDSLGYDFGFRYKGVEWQVEVKSSEGEPGFFELSPNEVDKARGALKKKGTKKGTRYEVIVVSNALSKEPRFTVLRNPYETRESKYFRIDEGGARVYFRAAEKTPGSE